MEKNRQKRNKKITWEELQTFFKGKVFLIGLTFVDQEENLIEQYQTSGIVDELSNEGFLKFKRNDNSLFQVPYDKETIEEAVEGEYREKSTGNIIVNPDFITTWTVHIKTIESIPEMKANGFSPADWTYTDGD
jgi:hypothetical protein